MCLFDFWCVSRCFLVVASCFCLVFCHAFLTKQAPFWGANHPIVVFLKASSAGSSSVDPWLLPWPKKSSGGLAEKEGSNLHGGGSDPKKLQKTWFKRTKKLRKWFGKRKNLLKNCGFAKDLFFLNHRKTDRGQSTTPRKQSVFSLFSDFYQPVFPWSLLLSVCPQDPHI